MSSRRGPVEREDAGHWWQVFFLWHSLIRLERTSNWKKEKSEQQASQSILRYHGVLRCEIPMGGAHQFEMHQGVLSFLLACTGIPMNNDRYHHTFPQLSEPIFSR